MIYRPTLAAVTFIACIVNCGQAAEITEIQLGGPRKVVAKISEGEQNFEVAVSLIPVRCFDTGLNTRLTRDKAAAYARVALGRHITGKSAGTVDVSIRNAEVTDSRMEEHRAVLTIRFPKDGLVAKSTTSHERADAAPKKVANAESSIRGGLFTAKNDLLATLQSLVDVLQAEMPKTPKGGADAEAFYATVAEHEELGGRRFKQFRLAVGADRLLLTIEREEIFQAAEAAENEFSEQLKERVKNAGDFGPESNLNKKFSDIEIEEKYRPYLAANALLMEVTGAKIIRISNKKAVIIAVASTALKDRSAKERLRAERVCKVKALASVVAEKEGVQVVRVERLEDKTQVVIDENGEKATSVSDLLELTRSRVNGIAKDMPVVGTWKSKDGEIFYLAIGVVIDMAE